MTARPPTIKAILATLGLILALLATGPAASAESDGAFLDQITLPSGSMPEGIAVSRGKTLYAGSLSTGSVYKADLLTGEVDTLVGPFGQFSTIGLAVDQFDRVWVAGGVSGTGRVYDGTTGDLLASYQFTAPFASFINDVIVTNRGEVWFTDSGTVNADPATFQLAGEPRLFGLELGPGRSLPAPTDFVEFDVDAPDIAFPNINGIVSTSDQSALIVAHSTTGELYRVDPHAGTTEVIDLGGENLGGGDGLARRGRSLYAVAAGQVIEIDVEPSGRSGTVVGAFPVVGAETPTTVAIAFSSLYVVDARFFTGSDPFRVYRIPLN
jgi:sugar lactone lactonase YvrE